MKWRDYWNQFPAQFEETEFLKQVQYTVSGVPISPDQLNAYISDIINALEIDRNDYILDMCCGNGMITSEISKVCSSMIGIDYSQYLIYIAKKYNNPDNVTYYCMSILEKRIKKIIQMPFTKVYICAALQYFTKPGLKKILEQIKDLSRLNSVIFIGDIPDKDRIWDFYDTEERRKNYLSSNKQNAIGTWWKKEDIADICINNGFDIMFLPPNELTGSAHYRFNIRLVKLGS
ncbi:class I SAM-dependent methyltransferase [Chloroflexota bacterium]